MLLLFRVGAFLPRMGGVHTELHECHSCGTGARADVCMYCFHTLLLELTYQLLYLHTHTHIYIYQDLTATGICRDHYCFFN